MPDRIIVIEGSVAYSLKLAKKVVFQQVPLYHCNKHITHKSSLRNDDAQIRMIVIKDTE